MLATASFDRVVEVEHDRGRRLFENAVRCRRAGFQRSVCERGRRRAEQHSAGEDGPDDRGASKTQHQ